MTIDQRPEVEPPAPAADPSPPIEALIKLLQGRRWVALTGAGMSTDSGIPDYRGPNARPTTPMQYAEFVGSPDARQRYWARSMLGWRSFGVARPNAGHRALAHLANAGLDLVITQNVDGLHTAAGSPSVLDLHGRISRVVCLDCGSLTERATLQQRLEAANPHVTGEIPAGRAEMDSGLRPDGDAVVRNWGDVVVVPCERCGGVLKPDVVFFGENVPRDRVTRATEAVAAADVVLVAGSSLTVMSGLRFVRQHARSGGPVAIINRGPTRGDDVADLRLNAGTSETLTALARALTGP